MSKSSISVSLEFTPNPNTLKFVVNQSLLEKGAANFINVSDTEKSPLAQKLFGVKGVSGVLIGTNFITITKEEKGEWDVIADEVPKVIENHLQQNLSVMSPDWSYESVQTETDSNSIASRIKAILDAEIRPAVAMDGGDITFGKFENGIVYLHLQGACSSCPSSIMTLKMGVENRLKEAIPEVVEVVQI